MRHASFRRSAGAACLAALVCTAGLARAAAQSPAPGPAADDPIGRALHAMYNLDFAAAGRILDAYAAARPADPLGPATRATVMVFEEYHRLQILELDFFGSDDAVTGRLRGTPDPGTRGRIMAAVKDARRLAAARLRSSPSDRGALIALGMAVGMEMQYAAIIEKRYLRTGSLSRESQALADRSLALNPPIYDAYVVLGSIEYVVGSLNPFYRFAARLLGLRADKARAVDHLRTVVARGQYFAPFARMLLSVVYVRDGRLEDARDLMDELRREFPGNPLFPREVARLDAKIGGG